MTDIPQGIENKKVKPKELRPEVSKFKEEISKADGVLQPLRKTMQDGRKLYIAAKHLQNPWAFYRVSDGPDIYDVERRIKEGADADKVNEGFHGWEEYRQTETPSMTGVLLVDVYAEQEEKIVPMGHMDWWLRNDYANGGGNIHQAPVPKQKHEQAASDKWHKNDTTAFKVEYDYHQQGIGSLMVASSAVVLPAIGTKRFYTGGLLEPAEKTYSHFGIHDSDFPYTDPPYIL